MSKRVIEHIATITQARRVCRERAQQPLGGDAERWANLHGAALTQLLEDTLPHGNGFDNGVSLDWDRSDPTNEKYVFEYPFHVMNDVGYYVGWATYLVTVTPSFIDGMNLEIEQIDSCDDADAEYGLDDQIADIMYHALAAEYSLPSHYYADV